MRKGGHKETQGQGCDVGCTWMKKTKRCHQKTTFPGFEKGAVRQWLTD